MTKVLTQYLNCIKQIFASWRSPVPISVLNVRRGLIIKSANHGSWVEKYAYVEYCDSYRCNYDDYWFNIHNGATVTDWNLEHNLNNVRHPTRYTGFYNYLSMMFSGSRSNFFNQF